MIKELMTWLKEQSRAAVSILIFTASGVLLLLIFAVIHSYTFSKEPRYVFGMKFGPEEKFDEYYDSSKFFKFREGDIFDVHQYNAPSYTLELSSSECMEFGASFFKENNFKYEYSDNYHVFAVIYPKTHRSASIGVRCTEYGKRGVTDVHIFGAGLDQGTTRSLVRLLDRKFEDGFPKRKASITFSD